MLRSMFGMISRARGRRWLHTESEIVFKEKLKLLLSEAKYDEAIALTNTHPDDIGRTREVLSLFKNTVARAGRAPPVIQYLGSVLSRGKLKPHECVELVEITSCSGQDDLLNYLVDNNKVEGNELIGDILKGKDSGLALKLYMECKSTEKVLDLLNEKRDHTQMFEYLQKTGCRPDYIALLDRILTTGSQGRPDYTRPLFREPVIAKEGPIGIFWDPKLPLVKGRDGAIIDELPAILRGEFNLTGPVTSFSAYGEVKGKPSVFVPACHMKGNWVPTLGAPNAVCLITIEMMRFARVFDPPACIVLMSANEALVHAFWMLRDWGYTTILISPSSTAESFRSSAVYWLSWDYILLNAGFPMPQSLSGNLLRLVCQHGPLHLPDVPAIYKRTFGINHAVLYSKLELVNFVRNIMFGKLEVKGNYLRIHEDFRNRREQS